VEVWNRQQLDLARLKPRRLSPLTAGFRAEPNFLVVLECKRGRPIWAAFIFEGALLAEFFLKVREKSAMPRFHFNITPSLN
jgi:hypothetical protein